MLLTMHGFIDIGAIGNNNIQANKKEVAGFVGLDNLSPEAQKRVMPAIINNGQKEDKSLKTKRQRLMEEIGLYNKPKKIKTEDKKPIYDLKARELFMKKSVKNAINRYRHII